MEVQGSPQPVSEEERERLLGAQQLVAGLPGALRELVLECFVEVRFAPGEEIVTQGEQPDGFYVLADGTARAVHALEDGAETDVGGFQPGDSFGESALLERGARSVTIRASGPVTALRLEPALFAAVVRRHPELAEGLAAQGRARRLGPLVASHPVFASLPREDLAELVNELTEVEVPAGETLYEEGAPAGPLYFVVDGRLRVSNAAQGDLRYLRGGDIFGEVSLFNGSARTAGVRAISDVHLLALAPDVFQRFLQGHPGMASRVAEQLAFYERGPARHVPLDFAQELLAQEEAEVAEEPAAAPAAVPIESRHSPLSFLAARRRDHVPYVPQLEESDGGAACLSMVCRAFGQEVRSAYVRDLFGATFGGASKQSMVRVGEALGLQMRELTVTADRLEDLRLPAIVRWPGERWAVLDEVRGSRVHIADPARGPGWIRREDLASHWDGTTLVPSATPALTDAPTERPDVRWLRAFVRPHAKPLLIVLVLALIAAGLQMLVPVVTGEIVENVVEQKDYSRLYLLTGGLLALQVVALGAALIQARMIAHVAVKIDGDSLDHIASRLLRLPLGWFESRRSGEVEQRLDSMRSVREFAASQGPQALAQAGQLIAAIVLMLFISLPLTALWLLTIPIYLLLVRRGVGTVRPAYQAEDDGFNRYRARQLDAIHGMETVKSLGAEEGLRRRMTRDFQNVAMRVARADIAAISYGGLTSFVTFLLLIAFLLFGSLEVMAGNLTIGRLVAFNSLVLLTSGPVIWLFGMWEQTQFVTVVLGRLRDILDHEAEQSEEQEASLRTVPTLEGRVTLKGVGFAYPSEPDRPILAGIDLDVLPGSTVAIVGRSGSGKSTLLRCLAGLLDVSWGTIAYDGVDLRELRRGELRRRIGLVPQNPHVFDDTLARNISLGEDEPDMAAVRAAAQIADVHDFAEHLPLGYDTRVGDGGLRLSGGQAQRVAIARSIYSRPSVLLLDEATSALDSESERAVRENMTRLLEGRTAFVVAHRLGTIRGADLILVIDDGRLAESGTHEQLFAAEGLYFNLYGQQLAG